MAIKVATDGYDGTVTTGGGVLLINGVLHEAVRPVNRNDVLWVPVRAYTGPIEHVDRRGDAIDAASSSHAEGVARELAVTFGLPSA